MTATIFIVDDDAMFRKAVVTTLETADFNICAYSSAHTFLESYTADQAGCLLLDICMPDMSGLELQQALLERNISLPIVFITAHGDVNTSVQAFRAGAQDFLQKPFTEAELLTSIERALQHDADSRQVEAERAKVMTRFANLTPREQQIMTLVVSDKSNKEIARELKISPRTIEHHREHVMRKMEVSSFHDLIAMAVICGLHELHA